MDCDAVAVEHGSVGVGPDQLEDVVLRDQLAHVRRAAGGVQSVVDEDARVVEGVVFGQLGKPRACYHDVLASVVDLLCADVLVGVVLLGSADHGGLGARDGKPHDLDLPASEETLQLRVIPEVTLELVVVVHLVEISLNRFEFPRWHFETREVQLLAADLGV